MSPDRPMTFEERLQKQLGIMAFEVLRLQALTEDQAAEIKRLHAEQASNE